MKYYFEFIPKYSIDNWRPTKDNFVFFRDFFNQEQEKDFEKMMQGKGIEFLIEKPSSSLNSTIIGHGLVPYSMVRIKLKDFRAVNRILAKYALMNQAFIANHYFQDYKAAELIEVLKNPEDWNSEDVAISGYLLEKQGVFIPESQIEEIGKKQSRTIEEGKKVNADWVILVVFTVIFCGFFINPLFMIGVVGIGWYVWKGTYYNKNGEEFFTFRQDSRLVGKVLFYAGWVLQFLAIMRYLYSPYNLSIF